MFMGGKAGGAEPLAVGLRWGKRRSPAREGCRDAARRREGRGRKARPCPALPQRRGRWANTGRGIRGPPPAAGGTSRTRRPGSYFRMHILARLPREAAFPEKVSGEIIHPDVRLI